MKKIFIPFFIILLFFCKTVIAQNGTVSNAPGKKSAPVHVYEYYVSIGGVTAKSDVVLLEKVVGEKKGVTFFMANRFPVRYFQLRSDRRISKDEFASWLQAGNYTLRFFGEGQKALEQILIDRKKAQ